MLTSACQSAVATSGTPVAYCDVKRTTSDLAAIPRSGHGPAKTTRKKSEKTKSWKKTFLNDIGTHAQTRTRERNQMARLHTRPYGNVYYAQLVYMTRKHLKSIEFKSVVCSLAEKEVKPRMEMNRVKCV